MKALIDQNLSFLLVDVLPPRGLGSCHVRDVGLAGHDDERVWQVAKDQGCVIVTEDNDFPARVLVRGHRSQVSQVCLETHQRGASRRCCEREPMTSNNV